MSRTGWVDGIGASEGEPVVALGSLLVEEVEGCGATGSGLSPRNRPIAALAASAYGTSIVPDPSRPLLSFDRSVRSTPIET
jgi:hypothetical protein